MRLSLLLMAALLAGCSSPVVPSDPGEGAEGGMEEHAIPAASAWAPPPGTWQAQQFQGEFTTTAIADPTASTTGRNAIEVPEGARMAWFNGTLTTAVPDGTNVRLAPPECASQDCFLEGPVGDDGAFTLSKDEPRHGSWTLVFFAETAAQRGSYTVEVNAFMPA